MRQRLVPDVILTRQRFHPTSSARHNLFHFRRFVPLPDRDLLFELDWDQRTARGFLQ
jgi:hypothetical protein